MSLVIGVHHPGTTVLHRTRASVKVVGLLVLVGVVLWWRQPAVVITGLSLAVLALASARVPWRRIARPLGVVTAFLTLLGIAQWFLIGPSAALLGVGRVATCVLLAWAVSLTTPVSQMLALFVATLRPLRHVGVNPDRVGLTIVLAIRSIPWVIGAVHDADLAWAARGGRRSVRALVVPSLVRTLRIADLVGDALVARAAAIDPPAEERTDPLDEPRASGTP